ncbi:hypothetical protein LMG28727_03797 [Paraburkholderia kirstenboschensis]|nr:hypothetical protein LMG28727_03797 [Paraburkholderia kirstenboschensis]
MVLNPGFIDALMWKWPAQRVCDERLLLNGLLTDSTIRQTYSASLTL